MPIKIIFWRLLLPDWVTSWSCLIVRWYNRASTTSQLSCSRLGGSFSGGILFYLECVIAVITDSYDINLNITMAFHMNISDRSRNITACLFDLWLHWFAEIAASDASSQYVDCLLENWSWRRWRQDQELRSQHNLLLTDTRLLYILDSPGRQLLP